MLAGTQNKNLDINIMLGVNIDTVFIFKKLTW